MDDSLKRKLVVFMRAFEQVFDDDWQYSQTVLENSEETETFLRQQYTDWGSHDALVSAYQDLRDEMDRQGLNPETGPR